MPLYLMPLLPLRGEICKRIPSMPRLWCPFSFPQENFSIYWMCVDAVTFWGNQPEPTENSLANLDAYLPLIAHMETTNEYSDDKLLKMIPKIGPACSLAHTRATMPDISPILVAMNLWTKAKNISGKYAEWAKLLMKATPLPCKGRNLENAFSEEAENDEVYVFIMRVLFGAFLGVFGGLKAPFWCRLWCYSSFVLYPPDVPQLQRFIIENKTTIAVCVENFILYSYRNIAFDKVFNEIYNWDLICQKRMDALIDLQSHVHAIAVKSDFLAARENWLHVENKLLGHAASYKKYCFRSVVQSFSSKVVEQGYKIWRKDSKARCYPALLQIPVTYFEHIWSIPNNPSDQRHFEAYVESLPSSLFDSGIIAEFNRVKHDYYMEKNSTGPQHLMAGTEKKKTGLYFRDQQNFFNVFNYCIAASHRLKIRWGLLPRSWCFNQADALAKRLGNNTLTADAGVYYFCPNCCKIRTQPVTFPNGADFALREHARYPDNIRFDLGKCQAYCKEYSPGRKKQIMKRRKRKPFSDQSGKNIRVCTLTPLTTISMIGILFYTSKDGNLVLCVDCGTMVKWTPECLSDRGPTCGCALPERDSGPQHVGDCAACNTPLTSKKKFRRHTVLNELSGELEEIVLCYGHYSKWINDIQTLLTKSVVISSIRKKQYAKIINGNLLFFESSF
jgi:hypothetical protein